MAQKIQDQPNHYLNFDSVSDFYKAPWLAEFPQGTTWLATGLDNGADEFYAKIGYQHYSLMVHVHDGKCNTELKVLVSTDST